MNIKKNLLLNTAYQLLNLLVPLITAPYLARTVGPEGIGIYAYYNSIAYYFVIFTMMGLNNYGNRTIARVRDSKEKLSEAFWNIYAVQTMFGVTSTIIYILFLGMVDKKYWVIAFINIFYVLSALLDISWFFSGLEKFSIIVTRNSIVKLISVMCVLCFVKKQEDIYIYVLIIALSALISQLSVWPFLKKEVVWIRPSWLLMKQHIVPNLILFIPVIAVSLYKIMDKIMIGILSTKEQVGFYENSEKIINIPQALINSLGTVMLPRMSKLLIQGKSDLSKQYMRDSMQYAMGLSIGAAFGLMAIADNFVVLFFGKRFVSCGNLIAFLAPTMIFNAWANVIRTQYLIPLNKDRSYILSVSMGAVVNIVFNSMLIGHFGAFGAVIGTIVAEFTVMLLQTVCVYQEIETMTYLKDNLVFLVAGFIMYIVVKFLGTIDMNTVYLLLFQIILGVWTYVLSGILLIRINKQGRYEHIMSVLKFKGDK